MNDPRMTDKPIVVFDLETTGKDTETARIVQFAAVRLGCDFVEESRMFRTLDPGIPIEAGATAVHGISDDDVKGAPKFVDIAPDIQTYMHDCDLAGHNGIAFDIPILMKEFERVDLRFDLTERRLIDTLELFRHFAPHTLDYALKHYCNEELVGAHDAMNDTVATAKVLMAQLASHEINTETATILSMGDRVTLDGKLALNEDKEIIVTFGKQKGRTLKDLAKYDAGFLVWILKKDFSTETKGYVRTALAGGPL